MAMSAREMAAHRFMDARGWAAPQLDRAAHSVEESLAPRLSAMLASAADRIDPYRVQPRSRWPMMLLVAGAAIIVTGVLIRRGTTQHWTEAIQNNAEEAATQVGETTKWAGGRAEKAGEKVHETADKVASKAHQRGHGIEKPLDDHRP
ncbi:hypothetical protein [Rhizohabitans arisaemae]|uniref:hypothetical protein n=1 Tax=Rhizohabitans arisaemae TaxID=2720610 RepID=UPI0024B0E004|nr:hypothetical protein [Rhizohabitans arisaemae]